MTVLSGSVAYPEIPTAFRLNIREDNNFTPMKNTTIRFQIGRSKKNREFYWRVRAANGEIIAQGEGYKRRAGCVRVFEILSSAFDHMTIRIQDVDANGKAVADVQYLGTVVMSEKKCCKAAKPVSVRNW